MTPLTRTFTALFGTQTVGRFIRFLYLLVIARLLSLEEVGIYIYGGAFYMALAVFASFGQGAFLASRLSKRPSRVAHLVSHSFALTLAAVALVALAGLTFVVLYEERALVAGALIAFLAAMVARSLVQWVRVCHVALEDAAWIPRYEIVFRGGEAMVGTALLLTGAGLLAICYLHALAWALEAAFAFRQLARRHQIRIRFALDRRLLARIVRVSAVFTASLGFLHQFAQVGVVTLRLVQPETAVVAQFGIAMQFLTTLLIAPVALGAAVLPAIGRVRRRGGEAEVAALATGVKAALIVGGVVAILADAYAPWLITLVLGARYAPAAETFGLLAWSLGPYAVAFVAGQALNALGGRAQAAGIAAMMVTLHVAALVVLLPMGPLDAALASLSFAALAGCVAGLLCLCPRLGVPGHGWWLRPLLSVAAVGLLMRAELTPEPWAAPAYVVLLLALAWMLRMFSGSELRFVLERVGMRFDGEKPVR